MSRPLSEVDRELLGETEYNNGAETTMAKANGGPGLEAHEEFPGTAFTPLNATAGTLVKVTTKGHDVETGKVSQHIHPPAHTSSSFYDVLSTSPHHAKIS